MWLCSGSGFACYRFSSRTLLMKKRSTRLLVYCRPFFSFICEGRRMNSRFHSDFAFIRPRDARRFFRTTTGDMNGRSTAGSLVEYMQATVVILPKELAAEFERFCLLNEASCPLIYTRKDAPPLDSDLRTDLTQYHIFENGVLSDKKVRDLSEYNWDNFVTFYIGCNCSFEKSLLDAGVLVRNIARGKQVQVSMYKTNIPCYSVGPFSCPTVVTMRPIQKEHIETAVQVTAKFDKAHGAPIHIGDPKLLGIESLSAPDFEEAIQLEDDDVPVFWACGLTSLLAVRSAKPKIFFSHLLGLYNSDILVEEFSKTRSSHGSLVPKVVIVSENPLFASVLSDVAMEKITQLETIIQDDPNNRGIKHLHISEELLKAALRLSHCTSVGIITGLPCHIGSDPPDENDGPPGALTMVKALQNVGKAVSVLVRSYHAQLYRDIVSQCVSSGILERPVTVVEYSPSLDQDNTERGLEFLFPNGKDKPPLFDMLIAIEAAGPNANGEYKTAKARDMSDVCGPSPVDELFQAALTTNLIGTIGIGDGGNEIGMGKVRDQVTKHIPYGKEIACRVTADQLITAGVSNWGGYALATALYMLYNCPVHSRYVRRGTGKFEPLPLDGFVNANHKELQLLQLLDESGVCDSKKGRAALAVDGLDFHPYHAKKLQQMKDIADLFISEKNKRKLET